MRKTALITPRDLLSIPDETVTLEAEMERPVCLFIDPPIADAEIEAEGLGRGTTDGGGLARIEAGRLPEGSRRFRLRATGERWSAPEVEALVCVARRDAPVFVTDIDQTLADVSSLGFAFRSNESVRPLDGAVEAMVEIARRMTVVYLTARDHIFTAKTRDWLDRRGFPEGPLYLRRVRFWAASPADHKRARLEELRARFTNIRWGVGDLPGDVEAYSSRGVSPILLSRRPLPPRFPGVRAASWEEVLELVVRDPRPDPLP